jgi:hypothetical protein
MEAGATSRTTFPDFETRNGTKLPTSVNDSRPSYWSARNTEMTVRPAARSAARNSAAIPSRSTMIRFTANIPACCS